MAANDSKKIEKYMLKGALKRSGFEWWRMVTNATSKTTGEERTFFIEFYIVNPALSTDKCLFITRTNKQKTEEELFQALTSNEDIPDIQSSEEDVPEKPSFIMVKAGTFQGKGKQINAFFSPDMLELGKKDFIIKLGDNAKTSCMLGYDFTQGVVQVTRAKLKEMPELDCNVGTIGWNLKFERGINFDETYESSHTNYSVLAGKLLCSGSIVFDGEEYVVAREKSMAFYDKSWGKAFPEPYYHISSNNLSSQISGKKINEASLVIHGSYDKGLSVLLHLDGQSIEFNAKNSSKYDLNFDCFEVQDGPRQNKIHWTISIADKKRVLDIDIFSATKQMFLRNYQCPQEGRKIMKILSGAEGVGEIRLYNKVKKNLETVEHARLLDGICEYGCIEDALEQGI